MFCPYTFNNELGITMPRLLITLFLLAAALTAAAQETITLQPGAEGKDTYICDCLPTVNNPNGTPIHLYQGQYGSCFDRMLIQWDLSQIPAGSNITGAVMKLKTDNSGLYGSVSGQRAYYLIGEDWEETGVTFATQPVYLEDGAKFGSWPGANQWVSVDITDWVQGWFSGQYPNYGIYGHAVNTTGMCVIGFYSSDYSIAANRPKLEITYFEMAVKQISAPKPVNLILQPASPNPFNEAAIITFSLPQEAFVTLEVFDITGKLVVTLHRGRLAEGTYQSKLEGKNLSSRVYFVRLTGGEFQQVSKIVLIK